MRVAILVVRCRVWLAAGLLALWPGGAWAQELRQFFGADDRMFVDASAYPWRAIGQVRMQSGATCTGVLVETNLVLTAAHCFFDDNDPERRDEAVSFVAGLDGNSYVALASIGSVFLAPEFNNLTFSRSPNADGLDWAFAMLDDDIGTEIGFIRVLRLSEGELHAVADGGWLTVIQSGYGYDHPRQQMAHIGCRIVRIYDDNTIHHECDTVVGNSGSPLFVKLGDEYFVIAIDSKQYFNLDGPYDFNTAVDARGIYPHYYVMTQVFGAD